MEPEKLGLLDIIAQAHSNPQVFAPIIARRVARLIISEIIEKDNTAHDSMNPLELIAISMILRAKNPPERKAEMDACVAILTPIVIKLIEEHRGGKVEKFYPNSTLRELVAHASLQILANHLEKEGKHELGHFLKQHTVSHPENADKKRSYSLKLIDDKNRMALMDRGIVNANPLTGVEKIKVPNDTPSLPQGETSSEEEEVEVERNRLWIGHDTQDAFKPKDTTEIHNIIVEMSSEDDTIRKIIEAPHISRMGEHIIGYNPENGALQCYSDPKLPDKAISGYETTLLCESQEKLGALKGIRIIPVLYTPWSIYEVNGTKKSISLCVHKREPSLSFHSPIATSKIDNTVFIVDKETGCVTVFGKEANLTGYKIDIVTSLGVQKGIDGEALYFIDTKGDNKKMIFQEGRPVFQTVEE